jgi:hypothetical protein
MTLAHPVAVEMSASCQLSSALFSYGADSSHVHVADLDSCSLRSLGGTAFKLHSWKIFVENIILCWEMWDDRKMDDPIIIEINNKLCLLNLHRPLCPQELSTGHG